MDFQRLLTLDLGLVSHTSKACVPGFKVGHPGGVVVRHPKRQMTRALTQDLHMGAMAAAKNSLNLVQSIQIKMSISSALIVHQAPEALECQGMTRRGEFLQALEEHLNVGVQALGGLGCQ